MPGYGIEEQIEDLPSGASAPSDALRAVYERRAEVEYPKPQRLPDPRLDRKFERMTALVAATLPAESLLDAGCGDGRFLAAIARLPGRPPRLVGTDIAERILETASRTLGREGASGEFVRANLELLPFADGTFDRVLSVQVIEHLLDVDAGARELARVLRSGGLLVLSTDNTRNRVSAALNAPRRLLVDALGLTGKRLAVTFPHRSFTRDELVRIIERAGLVVEHVETFQFHVDGLNRPWVKWLLNVIDRALPAHYVGDIIALRARKP